MSTSFSLFSKFISPLSWLLSPVSRPLSASQRGQSSSFVILIIIVVIFAVMLTGGSSSLFSGNLPSSVTDTPAPSGATGPTASPSTTISPAWSIDYTLEPCTTENGAGLKKGTVIGKGATNGYILIMKDVNGNFEQEGPARKFVFPETSWHLELSNSKGFNTKNWKLMLYSGGVVNNKTFSGGNLEATKNGSPTNCQ